MVNIIHCPSCGAVISDEVTICSYCGSEISEIDMRIHKEKPLPKKSTYDFGFRNKWLQWVLVVLTGTVSAFATVFDGTSFFTNDFSVYVWFLIIPLVFLITGIVKSRSGGAVLIFMALFFITGGPFAVINSIRLNYGHLDDSFGIGAVIGGIASLSYLFGIIIHTVICYQKSKK